MTNPVAEHGPDEIVETLDGAQGLASINRSEIDMQITTAKRYPRSISAFLKQAMEMATLDEETAGSMFYAVPRGGKTIEGPSVRLAEVAGSAWGNIRYASRVVEIGEKYVTAQGAAYDLEKNVWCAIEVRRRITDKRARRYDDDMITVTGNAACSIALRNAIFKVIPFAYVKSIYEAARQTSLGKALTMEQRRTRALEWYAKAGADAATVLKLLARKDVADISVDDLMLLQGLRTAIADGETTLETALQRSASGAGLSGDDLMPRRKNGAQEAPLQAAGEAGKEVVGPQAGDQRFVPAVAPSVPDAAASPASGSVADEAGDGEEAARIAAMYGGGTLPVADGFPSEAQPETEKKAPQMSLADELDAVGERRQVDGLLVTFQQAALRRAVKAGTVADRWASLAPGKGPDTCTVAEAEALVRAVEKIPLLKPAERSPAAPPTNGARLTFTLNGREVTTAGATKEQLLKLFALCEQVDKKAGKGLAAAMLAKEFGVKTRTDLTEEMAERYTVRLREVAEN